LANTLLGLAIIFSLKYFLNTSDVLANAAGYAVGIAMSFFLNKTITFAHSRDYVGSAMRFALVQIGAYALNLLTVLILVRGSTNSYVAQTLGILPYTLCGFLGAKFFAFAAADTRPETPPGCKR